MAIAKGSRTNNCSDMVRRPLCLAMSQPCAPVDSFRRRLLSHVLLALWDPLRMEVISRLASQYQASPEYIQGGKKLVSRGKDKMENPDEESSKAKLSLGRPRDLSEEALREMASKLFAKLKSSTSATPQKQDTKDDSSALTEGERQGTDKPQAADLTQQKPSPSTPSQQGSAPSTEQE